MSQTVTKTAGTSCTQNQARFWSLSDAIQALEDNSYPKVMGPEASRFRAALFHLLGWKSKPDTFGRQYQPPVGGDFNSSWTAPHLSVEAALLSSRPNISIKFKLAVAPAGNGHIVKAWIEDASSGEAIATTQIASETYMLAVNSCARCITIALLKALKK